jgi:dihydrofolate reductase
VRKIVVFNLISLDGFFAGEDGNIYWQNVDEEFNKFAVEHTKEFGAIIFGKTTYKLFKEFWPALLASESVAGGPGAVTDPKMSPEDREIAKTIDDMEKIVFSKSLQEVTWKNSKLFHDIDPEIVKKWKEADGKPMVIFGSGTIVAQMTNLGLIDEYRLMVNPIILGKGKPMFVDLKQMKKLKLINSRTFSNGNVLLTYEPEKKN